MIFGIGIDVLEVARIERSFEQFGEHFIERLLMPAERAQLARTKRPVRFLAMRFAAKEAIVKAMGTGFAHGMWIRDVGVVQNAWGKPEVVFSERGEVVRRKLGSARATSRSPTKPGSSWRCRAHAAHRCRRHERLGVRHRDRAGRRARPAAATVSKASPTTRWRKAMFTLRRAGHRQRVPAARAAPHRRHLRARFAPRDALKVWSLGDPDAPENELVERFFDGIENYTPDLVSLERRRVRPAGAALPRAACRCAGRRATGKPATRTRASATTTISAAFTGATSISWTCCRGTRPRARASLATIAALLGLPGKLGFARRRGVGCVSARARSRAIRHYCETDVLNTYLIYLRFELMRGHFTSASAMQRKSSACSALLRAGASEPHFAEFLRAWETRTLASG